MQKRPSGRKQTPTDEPLTRVPTSSVQCIWPFVQRNVATSPSGSVWAVMLHPGFYGKVVNGPSVPLLPAEALGSLTISHRSVNLSELLFWSKLQPPWTGWLGAHSGCWIRQVPSKSDWQPLRAVIQVCTDSACQKEEWPMLSPAVDNPERPENQFLGHGQARRPESKRIIQKWTYMLASVTYAYYRNIGRLCLCLWWVSNTVSRLVLPSPGETPTCLLYAGPFAELAQSSGMYFCLIKNLKGIYLAKSLALSNELNGSPTSDSARHPRPPMAVSRIFMERPCLLFLGSFLG